jgi:aminoglycoside phosphotransferase family enzyme/predicted kinase
MINCDLDRTLIQALQSPECYPHAVTEIRLLETHISWVLLAGEFAYKIKKPVDFGFLDFSTLAKRQFFCHEELRLNRRFAPGLYLDVINIAGSPQHPVFGSTPAFEYAVKMQRFAEQDVLEHVLERGELTRQHLQLLAKRLAEFHAELPPCKSEAGYGNPEQVAAPATQNFQQLASLLNASYSARLQNLHAESETEFQRCQPLFAQRLQTGKVRECHGDLHLGNLVLLDGQPSPFDCIEFNPELRWIDVINDLAFLLMDLQHRQRPDLAYACLDAYLQASGDYAGLAVLRFYLGYRAMVMAKVSVIRARQLDEPADLTQCLSYLNLAEQLYLPAKPALIITYGLPGCGKTTVSQIVLENYQVIRLRSDVERKRLFGLSAEQSSDSAIPGGIYTQEATQRTYQHLLDVSRQILQSGFSVIVDAAFLKVVERAQFRQLAGQLDLPFAIVAISTDEVLQRQRILARQQDASEADLTVLDKLKSASECLTEYELPWVVNVGNNGSLDELTKQTAAWNRLDSLILVD